MAELEGHSGVLKEELLAFGVLVKTLIFGPIPRSIIVRSKVKSRSLRFKVHLGNLKAGSSRVSIIV